MSNAADLISISGPGGGYLETRPIHIHQLRGSFLCSQFKMQSEIDCEASAVVYTVN